MILGGTDLEHINKLVDIYNYISLKYMIPVGGDDLDNIDGSIRLRFAQGDERFVQLNSDEVGHPKEGEVVYMDNTDVLCRRWNWRECDKSKMTEDTTNAVLVVEGLDPIGKADVENILTELAGLVQQYCGAETQIHFINAEQPTTEIQ